MLYFQQSSSEVSAKEFRVRVLNGTVETKEFTFTHVFSAIDEFDSEYNNNNNLNPVDWTPEKGFGTSDRRIFPRRGTGLTQI